MLVKIFALFALVAVALASPKPAPAPQVLTYSTGLDYGYPGVPAVPAAYSPYVSSYSYGSPLAYSAYPGAAVYLR